MMIQRVARVGVRLGGPRKVGRFHDSCPPCEKQHCNQGGCGKTAIAERTTIAHLQLKVDNGPESSGVRTPFLKRLVDFADHTGKPIQLLYYPPYPSKYNPIERCWGILEQHWNGTLLGDTKTMLEWANSMTWKGVRPIIQLSRMTYRKGRSLSKKAMREIEARLERNPFLPKWDILIRPA